ncbi:acyl-CoA thioesterase [Rubrivirga sp. IMCC43871]|uniref:acyl-CoA thioesterase n=1 Tax=Rubrivirga sp. IMCC43871 TaxID=3391575 RepID=UPI00398FDA25
MPDPLFIARVPVRWGDQDALGHVNNAAYLTYVEQARIEWLRSLADEAGDWPGAPTSGPILAAADLQFKRPIVYPATVVVRMTGRPPGRTSAGIDVELTVEGEDTVYATAATTLVWVDYATGRPTPLPDGVRERLS